MVLEAYLVCLYASRRLTFINIIFGYVSNVHDQYFFDVFFLKFYYNWLGKMLHFYLLFMSMFQLYMTNKCSTYRSSSLTEIGYDS